MSLLEVVSFVFFMINIGIFLAKLVNIMSYRFEPGERALKYYGIEVAFVLFIVSLLAWLFMFVSFATTAAGTQFLIDHGLPATEYMEYAIYLALTNIILVMNGIFTFIEIVLLMWANIRQGQERFRRGYGERQPRFFKKVTPRYQYK